MSLSDRDRKIAVFLVPLVLVVAYWFLLLAPKRDEAGKLGAQLAQAEQRRDDAQGRLAQLEGAKNTYAKDYETVVRLGKAIPSSLDMPSLLIQLNGAAKGTHIRFNRITAGTRADAPAPTPPAATGSTSSSTPASAAGGKQAQTGPGKATEQANNASQTSDKASQTAGADAGTTGSAGSATGQTGTSGVAGLDSIPLEFTFSGNFSDLANFFHDMKRFVRVANDRISVKGRLMTIDGLTFEPSKFPTLKAELQATVYLSPKAEGSSAGATANGPQATPASAVAQTAPTAPTGSQPAPSSSPVPSGGAEGSR